MKTSRKGGRESSEISNNSTVNPQTKCSSLTKSPSTIALIAKTSSPSSSKTKAVSATSHSPFPTKSTKSPHYPQQNIGSSKNQPNNKTRNHLTGLDRRARSEDQTSTTQTSTAALSTAKHDNSLPTNQSPKKARLRSDQNAPINTCTNDPTIIFCCLITSSPHYI